MVANLFMIMIMMMGMIMINDDGDDLDGDDNCYAEADNCCTALDSTVQLFLIIANLTIRVLPCLCLN